jgi:hypothetical protein
MSSLPPRERWTAVVIALLVATWMALGRAHDFRVYVDAGRHLLDAGWGAVYDPAALTPFKYHPVFGLAFAPWSLLPWTAARLTWAVCNGILIFDAQRRWVLHWRFDAVALAMGFLGVIHALSWQVQLANVTFVMLWCFTVALTTPRPWIRAGMHGLLLALKPYWLVLLLPWSLGRRWSTAFGAAFALVLISLVPSLFGATDAVQAYQSWFATLTGPAESHNFPKLDNQGWYALLSRHADAIGSALPWIWLAGCAVVSVLWLVPWVRQGWSRPGPVEEARLELAVIPVFLWAAPLSWMHHQILLWPLLAWLWMEGRPDRATRWVWIVSWLLLNATGRAVAGREFSRTLLRLGLPILSYPLLAWWGARCARARGSVPPQA